MPISENISNVRRDGRIIIAMIFLTSVALAIFGLVFNQARLWVIRVELQNSGDAAVLAATSVLVDDDLLRGTLCQNPSGIPDLLDKARLEANIYAGHNPVNARLFQMHLNPTNRADGDIVFGTLDQPRSKTFILATNVINASNDELAKINTIRVNARLLRSRGNAPGLIFPQFTAQSQHDVIARSSATLDRDVIGFRPIVVPSIPLAPLALLADYSLSEAKSWNKQIEGKAGADDFIFDRITKQFTKDASGDGLPEFSAVVDLDGTKLADANVGLLFIGTGAGDPDRFDELLRQLNTGVTKKDLQPTGGQFVLQANNQLEVTGDKTWSPSASDLHDTLVALNSSGAVRIWPLYCSFNGTNPVVCGFVAARVANVESLKAGDPLRFTLQPTMISSGSAVTDNTQRGVNGVPVVNLYICKVRLVE